MSRLFREDHPRCPKTGKLRWKTQKAAEHALKTIILHGHAGKAPDRAYPCESKLDGGCGGWHLTSAPRHRAY